MSEPRDVRFRLFPTVTPWNSHAHGRVQAADVLTETGWKKHKSVWQNATDISKWLRTCEEIAKKLDAEFVKVNVAGGDIMAFADSNKQSDQMLRMSRALYEVSNRCQETIDKHGDKLVVSKGAKEYVVKMKTAAVNLRKDVFTTS